MPHRRSRTVSGRCRVKGCFNNIYRLRYCTTHHDQAVIYGNLKTEENKANGVYPASLGHSRRSSIHRRERGHSRRSSAVDAQFEQELRQSNDEALAAIRAVNARNKVPIHIPSKFMTDGSYSMDSHHNNSHHLHPNGYSPESGRSPRRNKHLYNHSMNGQSPQPQVFTSPNSNGAIHHHGNTRNHSNPSAGYSSSHIPPSNQNPKEQPHQASPRPQYHPHDQQQQQQQQSRFGSHLDPRQLLYLTELMSTNSSGEKMVHRLVEATSSLIQAELIALYFVNQAEPNLICQTVKFNRSIEKSITVKVSDLIGAKIPIDAGVTGFVAKTGRAVNLCDTNDIRFDEAVDTTKGISKIQSVLTVPIRSAEGLTIAVIEALNAIDRPAFSQNDEMLLTMMAASASMMFGRDELRKALKAQQRQTEALHQIASLAAGEMGLDICIQKIVAAANLVVLCEKVNLYIVDEESKELVKSTAAGLSQLASYSWNSRDLTDGARIDDNDTNNNNNDNLRASSGMKISRQNSSRNSDQNQSNISHYDSFHQKNQSNEDISPLRIKIGDGVAGHVALIGRPVNVADVKSDWRFKTGRRHSVSQEYFRQHGILKSNDTSDGPDASPSQPSSSSSFASVPSSSTHLTANVEDRKEQYMAILAIPVKDYLGKTVAVLEAVNCTPNSKFTTEDVRLLTSVAVTAGNVLRQAQLYDEAIRRRKQTETLQQITELLAADIGTSMVVPRIINAAYRLVNAERISMFLVEDRVESGCPHPQQPTSPLRSGSSSSSSSSVSSSSLSSSSCSSSSSASSASSASSTTPATSASSASSASSTTPATSTTLPASEDDNKNKQLVCIVSKDATMRGRVIPWGKGIAGHVALTLKTLNITDAYKDPRFDQNSDRATGFVTHSILTVPVVNSQGKGVAVIQAINKLGGSGASRSSSVSFGNDDVAMFESLAVSAGVTLQKSRMYHATQTAEKKNLALMHLVKINLDGDFETVMDGIYKVAYEALDADRITVYFVDHNINEMFSVRSQDAQGWRLAIGQGVAGHVALHGQPINVKDAYQCPMFDSSYDTKSGYRTKSILCVPVKDDTGRVLAVIQALNKKVESVSTHTAFNLSQSIKMDSRRSSLSYNTADEAVMFNHEDEEVLLALCGHMSRVIRRCLTNAINHRGAKSEKIRSLLEVYSPVSTRRGSRPDSVTSDSALSFAERLMTPLSDHDTKDDHNNDVEKLGTLSSISFRLDQIYPWPSSLPASCGGDMTVVRDLDFDVFEYSDSDLMQFTFYILNSELNLVNDLQIPVPRLQDFLGAVRGLYQDNPFHNWKHGFSVFHFSFITLKLIKQSQELTKHDELGLLIASLCHDIDHPGNTNSFEINAQSARALIHNDASVLENHHAYMTFNVLRQDRCDIFSGIEPIHQRDLRKCIIKAILATDMTVHFDQHTKLTQLDKVEDLFEEDPDGARQMLINTFIHSSDLSGQVFPYHVAAQWEERISKEFAAQAELEDKHGLPVAPFMRGLDSEKIRAGMQVDFINFVLMPWWETMARLFPPFEASVQILKDNRSRYQITAQDGLESNDTKEETEEETGEPENP